MNAIECCGAYVPRYRIDASEFTEAWGAFQARGVSEKAVAESDEDAVTMAVEAIERALATSEYSRDDVDTLAMGTTTPPVDEGDVAAQVARSVACDVPSNFRHTRSRPAPGPPHSPPPSSRDRLSPSRSPQTATRSVRPMARSITPPVRVRSHC